MDKKILAVLPLLVLVVAVFAFTAFQVEEVEAAGGGGECWLTTLPGGGEQNKLIIFDDWSTIGDCEMHCNTELCGGDLCDDRVENGLEYSNYDYYNPFITPVCVADEDAAGCVCGDLQELN